MLLSRFFHETKKREIHINQNEIQLCDEYYQTLFYYYFSNKCSNPYWKETRFLNALKRGHLDVAKWFHSNFNCYDSIGLEQSCGYLHILKWIHKNFYLNVDFLFQILCDKGHLILLKWMRKTYPSINRRMSRQTNRPCDIQHLIDLAEHASQNEQLSPLMLVSLIHK